ncbi:MAG: 50S ribosomal protein L22 [Chloroflexota bacterium]
MEVRATAKNISISPRKVNLVLRLIRGKRVEEALNLLRFTPTPTAKAVAKVVKSAAANAENNYQLSPSALKIVRAFGDKGVTLKRFRPRSRGQTSPLLKRHTHITVIVSGEEG